MRRALLTFCQATAVRLFANAAQAGGLFLAAIIIGRLAGSRLVQLLHGRLTMADSSTFEPGATQRSAPEQDTAQRLARAVKSQTISHEDPSQFDAKAFHGLHHYP